MTLDPAEASVTLPTSASAEAVWGVLACPQRWPDVLPNLAYARIDGDGTIKPGAIIRMHAISPGKSAVALSYGVVVADRPHHLVLTSILPGLRARTAYVIKPTADGCDVSVHTELTGTKLSHRLFIAWHRKRYTLQLTYALEQRTAPLLRLAEQTPQNADRQ